MKINYLILVILLTLLWSCKSDPVSEHDKSVQQGQVQAKIPTQTTVIQSEDEKKTQAAAGKPAELAQPASERVRETNIYSAKSKAGLAYVPQVIHPLYEPNVVDRENYAHIKEFGIKLTQQEPVSTFSIDVDTGSYSNVRRMLQSGRLPVQDAVRVEELINYFDYHYESPKSSAQPFGLLTELAPSPWNKHNILLHIGIKAYDIAKEKRPASNLVFLLDVSGSMRSPKKLDLLKSSLKLLLPNLNAKDRISMVVYAGATGVVLEPTPGNQHAKIISALDQLHAGGSTNGGAGIQLAYSMARQAYIKNGINRILLATDGDFNVGTVNFEALKDMVEHERKSGISLTTLGFGTGNYNDHLMEQLADAGNGNYSYIDTLNEAQKVLVDEMTSTLMTVAKDVKIQIEFNPQLVAEYRLIGYENRALKREDFNNDKVDAGEIGAGHTVTAIYELTLTNSDYRAVEPLRYQASQSKAETNTKELAFLKLRYKKPNGNKSILIKQAINKSAVKTKMAQSSANFQFAAAVAAFGQILRGGQYVGDFTYDKILTLARQGKGTDPFGYRGEFISLVNLAKSLDRKQAMK